MWDFASFIKMEVTTSVGAGSPLDTTFTSTLVTSSLHPILTVIKGYRIWQTTNAQFTVLFISNNQPPFLPLFSNCPFSFSEPLSLKLVFRSPRNTHFPSLQFADDSLLTESEISGPLCSDGHSWTHVSSQQKH